MADQLTDLRPQLHGMWSTVSEAWARHANFVDARGQAVTDWLVAATAPTAGERVLELACGPGALTIAVAPLVDPGEVIASDVAVEMVHIAIARSHTHGFYNVHGRRLDIEDIGEPEATFELVYCRDGLQFALDPDARRHRDRTRHQVGRARRRRRLGRA